MKILYEVFNQKTVCFTVSVTRRDEPIRSFSRYDFESIFLTYYCTRHVLDRGNRCCGFTAIVIVMSFNIRYMDKNIGTPDL